MVLLMVSLNQGIGTSAPKKVEKGDKWCFLSRWDFELGGRNIWVGVDTMEDTSAYQGVRNVRFSENVVCFAFLCFEICPLVLLPTILTLKIVKNHKKF